MEEQATKTITAFDALFTNNKIQMLKILLPRLIPEQQGGFAVYIKLLELQYTLTFLRRHPGKSLFEGARRLSAGFFQEDNTDTIELLDELLPFSGPEERARIQNMKNMMETFKRMKEMMDMIQMMQELFPEGMGGDGSPMDFFSNMAGMGDMPDLSAMADMAAFFQNSQTGPGSTTEPGSPPGSSDP